MAAATEIEAQSVEETTDTAHGVQAFVKTRLSRVQGQFDALATKVKGQVAGLRPQLQGTLDKLRAAIKTERLQALLKKAPIDKVENAVNEGVKLTEETVQKLGLAKLADVGALKDAFDGMQKRIDQLKSKVDDLVKAEKESQAKLSHLTGQIRINIEA